MDNKDLQQEQLLAQYLDEAEQEIYNSEYDEIPIPLNFEGLVDVIDDDTEGQIPYDVEKFKKGVKDYSYIAGAFTSLRNCGMSEENAMVWLLQEVESKSIARQLEAQERIAKIEAEYSIKHDL